MGPPFRRRTSQNPAARGSDVRAELADCAFARQFAKLDPVLAACLTTICWAASAVFAARSSRLLGGTEANFWRLTVALVLLGLWVLPRGRGLENDGWPWFALSGLVGIGLGDTALFQALPRLGPRLTILLVTCFTPPAAAVLEWVWLETTLRWDQIVCGLCTLGGVALALSPGHGRGADSGWMAGVSWALASAVAGAVGAVLSRVAYGIAAAGSAVPDGATAAFERVLGGYGVVALAWYWGKRAIFATSTGTGQPGDPAARRRRAAPWILGNAVSGLVLGVSCYQWALSQLPAGIVLSVVSLTPLTIIPLAWWLEGDRPTTRSLIGSIIAVASVIGLVLVS